MCPCTVTNGETGQRGRPSATLLPIRSNRAWFRPRRAFHVGHGAFRDSTSLAAFTFPAAAAARPLAAWHVGGNAFRDCSALESIVFRLAVAPAVAALLVCHHKRVPKRAPHLANCTPCGSFVAALRGQGIRRTIVGFLERKTSSLRSIGDGAFLGCHRLTTIVLPEGLETVGEQAFFMCSNLVVLNIPETVTSIGDRCFTYCSQLAECRLPTTMNDMGMKLFFACTHLLRVAFPRGIGAIPEGTFLCT